jgi:hypothetical protein
LGNAHSAGDPIESQVVLITPPGVSLDRNKICYRNNELFYDGRPLELTDYLLCSVEITDHDATWQALPEIKLLWDTWNRVRSKYPINKDEYNQASCELVAALRTSPNIITDDADRIIAKEIIPTMKQGQESINDLFLAAGIDRQLQANLELVADKPLTAMSELDLDSIIG